MKTLNLKFNAIHLHILIRFNERIRINSQLISNDYLNLLLEECEFYNKGEKITF